MKIPLRNESTTRWGRPTQASIKDALLFGAYSSNNKDEALAKVSALYGKEVEFSKPRKKRTTPEDDEQKLFVQWLEGHPDFLFNSNGKSTYKSYFVANRDKAMGVRKGPPDLEIIHMPTHQQFRIEVKRKEKSKAHVSPEQKKWIEELNKISGVKATVCYGCDEAIKFIEENI